jgi:DHA2 family multidrug resistance protein
VKISHRTLKPAGDSFNMHPAPDDQKIQWSVISVILIGTFMAVLNGSIVNVALPKIMAIFNATSDSIQWVLTCYLMTLGVVMPATGFMADRFGYKRMYFIALALFTAGFRSLRPGLE